MRILDNKEAFERLAICNKCEELDKERWACNKCGCYMKIKARKSYEECPIGKWGKVEE